MPHGKSIHVRLDDEQLAARVRRCAHALGESQNALFVRAVRLEVSRIERAQHGEVGRALAGIVADQLKKEGAL